MNTTAYDELHYYENKYGVSHSIADLTPTICSLHGLSAPAQCGGTPVASVVDHSFHLTGKEGGIEKTLIFAADAVGEIHRRLHPELLERVEKLAGFRIPSSSVMPSVTPVCYASIFTGSSPKVHGIQKYEKPVLETETLFDVFAKAGKNVAIVSINGCSIDCIFRKRNIDYYSTRTDEKAFLLTQKLLEEDQYDLIVCYYTSFDSFSHSFGHQSREVLDSLETGVSYFEQLVLCTEQYWKKYNRAVVWCPDHGNHIIDETCNSHGEDIFEDMVVNHFYRLRSK